MNALPILLSIGFVCVLFDVEQVLLKYLALRARRTARSRRFPRVRTFRVGSDLLK